MQQGLILRIYKVLLQIDRDRTDYPIDNCTNSTKEVIQMAVNIRKTTQHQYPLGHAEKMCKICTM